MTSQRYQRVDSEDDTSFRSRLSDWQPTQLWNVARKQKRVAALFGSEFSLLLIVISIDLGMGKSIPGEWGIWCIVALLSMFSEWVLFTVVTQFLAQPTILGSQKVVPFIPLILSLVATFILGFGVGVAGTVRIATLATSVPTWQVVLNAIGVAGLIPTSLFVHGFLWGVAFNQNRDPDNSWVLQCIRCSCLLPRTKRLVCIFLPLLSVSTSVFTIAGVHWKERETCKHPIHEYLLGAGILCILLLLLGAASILSLSGVNHRRWNLLLWVFTAISSLAWAFAGIPWIHASSSCSDVELLNGAYAVQVFLFCLGITSGIVTFCCRVEACCTDYDAMHHALEENE